jgi:DNA primase
MTGRDITGDRSPKWFNYSGLNKSKYLFGGHLLKTGKPVILVEGPGDALMVHQAMGGDVGAVACMGSGLTKEHVVTIKNSCPSTVYIFADGDAAGRIMARKAVKSLKPLSLRLVQTPFGEDPGSLSIEAIRDLIKSASIILRNVRWNTPLGGITR